MVNRKHERWSLVVDGILSVAGTLFILLLSVSSSGQTQESSLNNFQLLTTEDGLPSNAIFDLVEDNQGYLWAATDNGLARYDGYTFKTFRRIRHDEQSIQANYIARLALDKKGNIWYGSIDGKVGYYESGSKRFVNFAPESAGLPRAGVSYIFFDRYGNGWFGIEGNGLYRYNDHLKKFFHVWNVPAPNPGSFVKRTDSLAFAAANSLYDIHEDGEGIFWIASHRGLFSLNPTTLESNKFHDPIGRRPFPRSRIYFSVAGDDDDGLWIGGWMSGLRHFNRKTNSWKTFHATDSAKNIIRDVRVKSSSELWVNTDDGWGIFNIDTERFIFPHFRNNVVFAQRNLVDRSNVVWIACTNGLYKYTQSAAPVFYPVAASTSSNEGVFGISGFYHDLKRGKLYFGTVYGDGVHVIDRQTGVEHIVSPGSVMNIHDLVKDENTDSIFIAAENCVYILDLLGGKLTPFFKPGGAYQGDRYPYFFRVRRTRAGDVWMATLYDGIFRYNHKTRTVKQFLNSEEIHDIIEDNFGRVWIGSPKRIRVFSEADETFTEVYSTVSDSISVGSSAVTCMTKTHHGDIWISTHENGLLQVDGRSSDIKFSRWTTLQGLPSDVIYTCASGPSGLIWAATPESIFSLDPKSSKVRTYPVKLTQTNMSMYCDDENTLFIESFRGYYTYQPSKGNLGHTLPQMVINSIKVFDKEISFQMDSSLSARVELDYDDNFVSFEFAAIHMRDPAKNQYAYKMDKVDNDWVNAGNRRYVSYANLQPGEYIFRIKGTNDVGDWSSRPVEIMVVISPPFWQTLYFKFLVAIIFVLIIVGINRAIIERKLAMARVREKISRDLHDEMGSNLSTINILTNVAIGQLSSSDSGQNMREMLGKISDLSHDVMESMDQIVWSIDPQHDSFDETIARMRAVGGQLLEKQNINYKFVVDGNLSECKIDVEKRNDFYLIYKEAITNIAKYAKCKNVLATLSVKPAEVNLSIVDDGIGFDPRGRREGNGLHNIRARSRNLNGQLKIESEINRGTRIDLEFPL